MKIKNRVVISVILTVLFLFASVGIWFVTKPLQVGLNLSGDAQKANIAVIFNRKNNNEFHKVRKADKLIYISKNTKVDFDIYI